MSDLGNGFINIYKPCGYSSAYIVGKIRRKFNIKTIGHMGTLDPMASGVLPIAISKATRMFDYYLNKDKSYVAQFTFGYSTNTLDAEGEVVEKTSVIPHLNDIIEKLSSFSGEQMQLPPQFSAKKINGKNAYEWARSGVEVVLKPKKVNIYEIKLLKQVDDFTFEFFIKCSSGTYIRSIARDLSKSLNSLATMTSLIRVESGAFNAKNAIDYEKLINDEVELEIIDIESIFPNIKTIEVIYDEFYKLKNGISINKELSDDIYFVKYLNKLLGVASVCNNTVKLKTYLYNDNNNDIDSKEK